MADESDTPLESIGVTDPDAARRILHDAEAKKADAPKPLTDGEKERIARLIDDVAEVLPVGERAPVVVPPAQEPPSPGPGAIPRGSVVVTPGCRIDPGALTVPPLTQRG